MSNTLISVGLAQIAPVWLNREATIEKIVGRIEKSANEGCALVVFGEAARKYKISVYLGIIERAADRGGHSLLHGVHRCQGC
jgi:predicted amidohydrolase